MDRIKYEQVGFHIATGECKNRCSCTFNKCIDDNYYDNCE